MARILGIDTGTRRIGIAVSDETETITRSLEMIPVKGLADTISKLKHLIDEFNVSEVVVGMPFNMNGSEGPAAKYALKLVEKLKSEIEIPILTFDERLTTKQAEAVLINADISRKKRKLKIDGMAAQIMLQAYLDYKKCNT